MKKSMKKFIVACAAVSAITVAAGISAMAAEYTADNNSVKFTVPAGDADTQKTVLVVPAAAENNVTDADILYINQDANLADTALLKGTSLADGTYLVMVGYYDNGTFSIERDTFTIGNEPPVDDVMLGDVNDDKQVNVTDVLWTAQAGVGTRTLNDREFKAADVNKSNDINVTDVLWIAQAAVGTRTLE